MCTAKYYDCLSTIDFEKQDCIQQCSGILVTSKTIGKTKLKAKIAKLSADYWNYKGFYNFSSQYKGSLVLWITFIKYCCNDFCLEYEYAKTLRFVKIRFDAPVFDKVTKDRAAKFVDQLSAIGGTMGLLTGFSIISGVEILYFGGKSIANFIHKMK